MLIRDAIEAQLSQSSQGDDGAGEARLPRSLRLEPASARVILLKHLASSRRFGFAARSGVVRRAVGQGRGELAPAGRQRVIVKALVSRHGGGRGGGRAKPLTQHLAYLARRELAAEARPAFFDRADEDVDALARTVDWRGDRHHFRFIVSPEHGDRLRDLRGFVREVMEKVSADLDEPALEWIGICHYDTDQPHAHILLRGRRGDGRDLVLPRRYIAYGLRARAEEVAEAQLGDFQRIPVERQIWRDLQANRFTELDRRLLEGADAEHVVDDAIGRADAWGALTRGRLQHLERLGYAEATAGGYRLHSDLEAMLRDLEQCTDRTRAINQRRLESGQAVRELGESERVSGQVVAAGGHDAPSAGWVIVRDRSGTEHFARLQPGQAPPELGRAVEILGNGRGLGSGRGERGFEVGL